MNQLALICFIAISVTTAKDVSQDVGPEIFDGVQTKGQVKEPIVFKNPEVVAEPIVAKKPVVVKAAIVEQVPIVEPMKEQKMIAHMVLLKPSVHPVAMASPPVVAVNTATEEKAEHIRKVGLNVAKFLTAKLSAPVVFSSSKTSALAGALPSLLAKKGAILGSLIATPLQWQLSALSSLHSAANGAIVSIPVAIGTGMATGAVYAKDKLDNLHNVDFTGHIHNGIQELKSGAATMGHLMFKPAMLTAAKTSALLGHGLSAAGAGATHLGNGLQIAGLKMGSAGTVMNQASNKLLESSLGSWRNHPMLSWLSSSNPGQIYVVDTPFVQIIKNVPVTVGTQAVIPPVAKAVGAAVSVSKGFPLASNNEYFEYDMKNETRRKRSAETNQPILPVDRAIRLMKSIGIEQCIARVICELSCDLKGYGENGKLVFNNLLSLQMSEHSKNPDFDIYRRALMDGRKFGSKEAKACDSCSTLYSKCQALTEDLLAVASLVKVQ